MQGTPEVDSDEFIAARRACRRYRALAGGAPSAEEQQEMLARAVAYAECLRTEGVDVPDPKTDEDGKSLIGGEGLDRNDPAFSEADETCRSKVRGLPAPWSPGGEGEKG